MLNLRLFCVWFENGVYGHFDQVLSSANHRRLNVLPIKAIKLVQWYNLGRGQPLNIQGRRLVVFADGIVFISLKNVARQNNLHSL